MEWYIILALAIGIFIILFPIAYVWYLNMGGIYSAIRRAHEKQAVNEEELEAQPFITDKSTSGILKVQVFRKANKKGITQPIGYKEVPKE